MNVQTSTPSTRRVDHHVTSTQRPKWLRRAWRSFGKVWKRGITNPGNKGKVIKPRRSHEILKKGRQTQGDADHSFRGSPKGLLSLSSSALPAPEGLKLNIKGSSAKSHPIKSSYLSAGGSAGLQNRAPGLEASGQDDISAPNTEDGVTSSKGDYPSSPNSTPPPLSSHEIDNFTRRMDMKAFGENLQKAANAVFPNDNKSRYIKVSVLLLSWQDEDPKLPVSDEIKILEEIFRAMYHFETEHWKIPDENSHYVVNEKVLAFVKPGGQSAEHLKIIYYAGHARLTHERSLAWTRYEYLFLSYFD